MGGRPAAGLHPVRESGGVQRAAPVLQLVLLLLRVGDLGRLPQWLVSGYRGGRSSLSPSCAVSYFIIAFAVINIVAVVIK